MQPSYVRASITRRSDWLGEEDEPPLEDWSQHPAIKSLTDNEGPSRAQLQQQAHQGLKAQGYQGDFNAASRRAFIDHVDHHYTQAENATNGYLLTPKAQRLGINPKRLFHGNPSFAAAHASDELKDHWNQVGRPEYSSFKESLITGGGSGGNNTSRDWTQTKVANFVRRAMPYGPLGEAYLDPDKVQTKENTPQRQVGPIASITTHEMRGKERKAVLADLASQGMTEHSPYSLQYWAAADDKNSHAHIARDAQGQILGVAGTRSFGKKSPLDHTLRDLYVTPDAQKLGVGSALLSHAAHQAAQNRQGFEVSNAVGPAEGFYAKMGGTPKADDQQHFTWDEDATHDLASKHPLLDSQPPLPAKRTQEWRQQQYLKQISDAHKYWDSPKANPAFIPKGYNGYDPENAQYDANPDLGVTPEMVMQHLQQKKVRIAPKTAFFIRKSDWMENRTKEYRNWIDQQPFYHASPTPMEPGTVLKPAEKSMYQNASPEHVYFSHRPHVALSSANQYVEHPSGPYGAVRDGQIHLHMVQPQGNIEQDDDPGFTWGESNRAPGAVVTKRFEAHEVRPHMDEMEKRYSDAFQAINAKHMPAELKTSKTAAQWNYEDPNKQLSFSIEKAPYTKDNVTIPGYDKINAFVNGQHAGHMLLAPQRVDSSSPHGPGEIADVQVHQDHRGTGIAREMAYHAQENDLWPKHSDTRTPDGDAFAKATPELGFTRRRSAAPVTLYHGTHDEGLAHIQQNGLQAPSGVNPAMWPMLTDNFDQAARYGQGKVVEYQFQPQHLDFRHPEGMLWPAQPHDVYGHPANAYGIKNNLPPSMITKVHDTGGKKYAAKSNKCKKCDQPATVRVLWAEGMAYVPACDKHKEQVKRERGSDFSGFKPFDKVAGFVRTYKAYDNSDNSLTFEHLPPGTGPQSQNDHRINAFVNGAHVGYMDLDAGTRNSPKGLINYVSVRPNVDGKNFRNKGIARAMGEHAQSLGIEPIHSDILSGAGTQFAQATPQWGRWDSMRNRVIPGVKPKQADPAEQMSLFGYVRRSK